MSSIGLNKGQGIVPVLQREWVADVQDVLQKHNDRLDDASDAIVGVTLGIQQALARSLKWPVRIVCGSAVASALFLAGIFATEVAHLFRPIAEVIR